MGTGSTRHVVAAADLFVGAACPGCGRAALAVCARCAAAIRPAPFDVTTARRAGHLQVTAAGPHRGALRRVVVDWKEHGRFPLTDFLSHHLAAAVATAADGDVALVPVPTSWPARWRRGDDLVLTLARAAAERLARVEHRVTVHPVLRRARRTADQAGLGAEDRAVNMHHAFLLIDRHRLPLDTSILIIDDVVTTGSTLAEAARALAVKGWGVQGAATIAATAPGAERAGR